jgi:hypothetical protein
VTFMVIYRSNMGTVSPATAFTEMEAGSVN